MANDSLERNLRDGIEAARRGDKLMARRLLQQVLQQDRTNEIALMWMASVVDTLPERRAYLEQVLRINPGNDRARQALAKLGGTPPPASKSASASASEPLPRPTTPSKTTRRRGMNPYFMAAIAVGAVMVLVLVLFLLSQPGEPEVVEQAALPTTTSSVLVALGTEESTSEPLPEPTETPTPLPTAPRVIVTLDPAMAALPPTFTPTPTPEPSATPTPSPTPEPLSSYPILFSAVKAGDVEPSLFRGAADASDLTEVGDADGYYDIALSPDSTQIAFVRRVDLPDSEEPVAQLFVAPVSDPTQVRQLTSIVNGGLEHPAWSGDGRSIVFSANVDGDYDLFRVPSDPDGEVAPEPLTTNDAQDSYPAFAPGSTDLLFVSDQNSPGFLRLFELNEQGIARPFSNITGIITEPNWSPDGSQIAYVNQRSGDPDIYVVNARGERPVQLTVGDSATERALAWSGDGQWIAFASDRNSGNRFLWYFLNVDSGEIVPLQDLAEAQSLVFLPR